MAAVNINFGYPTQSQQLQQQLQNGWFDNYLNKWGGLRYNLLNTGISAGTDLVGNFVNYNSLSHPAGNIMSGIGNIVGNIPGPIGWAGKALSLAGAGVNALWGHKFNDANVAAAENANRERNNWLFGDYSNTDALLAGSMANVLLGNVSKSFLGKEGPFSNAVTNKMKLINNDRILANLRANNSELNAYNNYLTGMVRNAIAGDSMGNVNAAASGGPLNMINGTMTPFGNRYFANGGYTHGGLFTNGFVEVNNGGSHELNPNQGVQYGMDLQGTPNMVEEGETILDNYVFSDRIKFPKKYKNEFALGGKIWKKTFADISKMIAKESEERPNDPISQQSLKALGGKLADIQEEVKARQALSKMDPREVMAMLQQMAMMLQGGQPLMEEQLMMQDPYQQAMMSEEQQPIMAACGGKLFANGGNVNLFPFGGNTISEYISDYIPQSLYDYANSFQPTGDFAISNDDIDIYNNLLAARRGAARRKKKATSTKKTEQKQEEKIEDKIENYGFLKSPAGLSDLSKVFSETKFYDKKSVAKLLLAYVKSGIVSPQWAVRFFDNILLDKFPGRKEGVDSGRWIANVLGAKIGGYEEPKLGKDGKPLKDNKGNIINEKTPWYGKDYWEAIQNEGEINQFNLNRGFSEDFGEGYSDLSLSFDFANQPKDIQKQVEKYFKDYGSTDKGIVTKYKNLDVELKRKNVLDIISKNNDILNQLSNVSPELSKYLAAIQVGDWDEEDTIDPRVNPYLLPKDELEAELKNNNPFTVPVTVDKNGRITGFTSSTDPNAQRASDNKLNEFYKERLKLMSNYYNNLDKLDSEEYLNLYEKEILSNIDKETQRERDKIEKQNSVSEFQALPTWMRYAPLAFSSIATLTDALGLTNKPDMTPYNLLIALSNRLNRTPVVRSHPVFQPMLYLPMNTNYDLGLANNLYANTSRAINDAASGNIGAAIVGNLTALNNAGNNYAKIRQVINEQNIANQKNVMDYNNKGAYQDAMASMEAQKINSANMLNAQRFGYQALADALRYYQTEQQAANAAKQVNLTHAVNSWANVGRENMYMNMINSNKAWDYGINPNGVSFYKALLEMFS